MPGGRFSVSSAQTTTRSLFSKLPKPHPGLTSQQTDANDLVVGDLEAEVGMRDGVRASITASI